MFTDHYITDAGTQFRATKTRAERALAQVDEAQFFARPDAEHNSIALIVKHVAGNLRSRWTDVFTTDGEKPDRRRDFEFEPEEGDTRASLMERWEAGWGTFLTLLDTIGPDDLDRTITIRAEPHSLFQAIERQKTHYNHHVGQIVLLCRMAAGDRWQSLSVPRGGSAAFERSTRARFEPPTP